MPRSITPSASGSRSINPLGQRFSYTYSTNGQVQTVQDPLLVVTTVVRDQVNRVTSRTDGLGNTYSLYLRPE